MGDPLGSPRAEWPEAENIVIRTRGGCDNSQNRVKSKPVKVNESNRSTRLKPCMIGFILCNYCITHYSNEKTPLGKFMCLNFLSISAKQ